jgi:hypothetical protein
MIATLAHSPDAASVSPRLADAPALQFSQEQLAHGRAVARLKRRFESIARSWGELTPLARRRYERANLAPQLHPDTRRPVYALEPDHFLFSVLGVHRWGHRCYEDHGARRLLTVDPWLVTGGFRKRKWHDLTQGEFEAFADSLDACTRLGDPALGSTTQWLEPFPLLWATEGKNRVQLYQDLERPMPTLALPCRFLPAESLRLYRSVLNDSVWLLRWVDEAMPTAWAARMARHDTGPIVMPFPDEGVPLLLSYGVKADRGWGAPWRISKAARAAASRAARVHGWS